MDTTTQPRIRLFHPTPGRFVLALLVVECLLWLSERFGWLGWHKGYAVLTAVAVVGMGMLGIVVWYGVALVFRRPFQFSLRSLLVLVVVVALPCSWLAVEMRQSREQKKAVDMVMMLGGSVFYDERLTFDTKSGMLPNATTPEWLWNLLGEDFFAAAFQICPFTLSYQPWKPVEDAAHLNALWLSYSTVTDAKLAYLKGFPQLRELYLTGTAITDTGLGHLKGLTELRVLWIEMTQITNAGLGQLTGLNQLEHLHLWSTRITKEGVAQLQQSLPKCEIIGDEWK